MPRLAPRPLLMIHGGGDTYIKPGMAQQLFAGARQPKELWLVEKAKHNQALQVAGDEYRQRVLAFFETHLTTMALTPRMTYDGSTGDLPTTTNALNQSVSRAVCSPSHKQR